MEEFNHDAHGFSIYPILMDELNLWEQWDEKCKGDHKIDGKTPMLLDIQYDGRTCDCGRMKYYTESCGCESNPHLELKKKPNE